MFYVEGLIDGPASFRKESDAREYAQRHADRFNVVTTLHSTEGGHTGIRPGVQRHSAGRTLDTFRPRVSRCPESGGRTFRLP